jgi:5-methylcytosine-specific restriction protein B
MNTADRSVEALDTALRRRFSFTEMPARYDLAELDYEFAGAKGSEILKKINKRIEKLLDRDHLIGHSYFLLSEEEKQQAETKLMDSFYRNIIPLLQEYFFGDYAKIGAVLGSGFVYTENENDQADFATGYENEDFAEKDIYQIIDYRPNQTGNKYIQPNMTFEKAIRLLMNQTLTTEFES